MRQGLQTLLIIMGIVASWALPSALFGWKYENAQPCMSLAVVICALLLLLASRNENTWRRLTWQPYDEKQSAWLLLGFLFGIPVMILVGVLVTWFVELIELLLRWLGILALAASI